jgi:alpha-mannosidase
MPDKPILYLSINNHFDPTWRRCWDRRFEYKGNTFVSYADLEEYYLLDNLELAAHHPEYKFEAEFSLVIQKFLERHPERLVELRDLVRAGRFAVTGGGQVIVDSNMILGESLTRNFVIGLLWVEETLNQPTRLGVRNDAFGNSAQLPQILRGVELDWATGLSYSPAHGRYWRGLDGSTILHTRLPLAATGGGGAWKYSPCPACHGVGGDCAACAGRGIAVVKYSQLPVEVLPWAFEEFGCAYLNLGPEELLPNPHIFDWIAAQQNVYDVRFTLEQDLRAPLQKWLDLVDYAPQGELHDSPDLNPNNSGVLVTRIRTKQTARRQEYALLAAEWLNTLAALRGQPYPRAETSQVWKDLLFTLFHDAITATHIDPAYAELQDFWARIDAATAALRTQALSCLVQPAPDELTLLNSTASSAPQVCSALVPAGDWSVLDEQDQALPVIASGCSENGQTTLKIVAAVPPHAARALRLVPASSTAPVLSSLADPLIENERFRIRADEHGLLSIYDLQLGREILAADEYRPGELILEHDEGSPWATLHPDQSRTPLSATTRLASVERHPAFQSLLFEVNTPFRAGFVANGCAARVRVTLYRGIPRVDFQAEVDWETYNHRLRVAFPLPFAGRHLYEIPYGVLERKPYPPRFDWTGANGDWPAINWAGVESDRGSLVVFNRGLPSYKIESGRSGGDVILLSLLRSPAVPTYLHEPEYYSMTDFDGMRDAGQHSFDFALSSYSTPFAASSVVLDAEGYNAGLLAVNGRVELPPMPQFASDCARLASIKWAEQTDAVILRIVEFRGTGGEARLSLPDWAGKVAKVNLLERQNQPLPVENGQVCLSLRPWEIATVWIEKGGGAYTVA